MCAVPSPSAPTADDDVFNAPEDDFDLSSQAVPPVHATSPSDPFASVRKHPKKAYNGNSFIETNSARTAASRAKREEFFELVKAGKSITEAVAELGIGQKTYEYWRRTDAVFKANIDVVRQQNGKNRGAGWTGDSISFNDTFFPEEFSTPGFHHEFHRVLKDAKPGTITLINTFPNSAKTRIIENHICETLATDPHHRFVIASKAVGHAKKILGTVQDRMTNIAMYPGYIGRFGPFYVEGQERSGKPWTREYIKLAQNDSNQRDYNVQVMGWSGQILGSRVDTIILDDIQTTDNLAQVEAMITKFRRDFYTRLKGGRIIIIGNRIENGDFYEKLLELDVIEPSNHIDFPAIDIDGNSLWPERWPVEELAMVRKMVGEKIWWTTYMQKPQLGGTATFDEKMLDDAKDWSRKVGVKKAGEPCLLSLDPGLDPGVTAIHAMTYDVEKIRVIDSEQHNDFSRQEDILNLIEAYAIRYAPQRVVIETVAYQRALARDERLEALARKYGFIVVPHNTNRNKIDPVMGVAAMAGSFLRNEISFPYEGGPGSVSAARMDPVLAELGAWRPNIPTKLLKQDFTTSLWFGWVDILNQRHGMGIKAEGWRRSALPSWTLKVSA